MADNKKLVWEMSSVRDAAVQLNARDSKGRQRFVENPEAPIREFDEFMSAIGECRVLLLAPCSYVTYEYACKHFDTVIITDYNKERLQLFCRDIDVEVKSLHILSLAHFRLSLAEYKDELCRGLINAYIPRRFQGLDGELTNYLGGHLLEIQKEFCSHAANRSMKRWHSTVNRICNMKSCDERLGAFPDVDDADVVIVGAGPSLDYTVDSLFKLQDRAYVIATDGSLQTLIKNGVVPDFLVSCEDTVLSWRFVAGLEESLRNVPLFMDFKGNHQLAANYPGPVVFTCESEKDLWYEELSASFPILELGRCVGHMAFNLAVAIGAGRIVMTGFDLAFRNDSFHPKNMPVPYFHDAPVPVPVEIPGRNGELLRTDISMRTYLKDFEWLISQVKQVVVDATEGGSLKQGATIMTLEEALCSNTTLIKNIKLTSEELSVSLKEQVTGLLNAVTQDSLNEQRDSLISSCGSYLLQDSPEKLEFLEDREESKKLLASLNGDYSRAGNRIYLQRGPLEVEVMKWLKEEEIPLVEEKGLPEMLNFIRVNKVEEIYCCNSGVSPDIFAIPSIKCVDIKTDKEVSLYERSLWIPGYSVMALSQVLDFWKNYLPIDVQLSEWRAQERILDVG